MLPTLAVTSVPSQHALGLDKRLFLNINYWGGLPSLLTSYTQEAHNLVRPPPAPFILYLQP